MKKVLLFALAAGLLTACNSGSGNNETKKDSTVSAIDSTADARVDSIQTVTDSLKEKTEHTFEKTDSANKAIADSASKAK
jgi:gas vesicle protein